MSKLPNGTYTPSSKIDTDMSDVADLFHDKEKFTGEFRIKAFSKKTSSGADGNSPDNWIAHAKALEKQDENQAKAYTIASISLTSGDKDAPPRSPGIITTSLDEKFLQTFKTGRPQVDQPDYVVCTHCKKPIMRTHAVAHIKSCVKQKAAREAKAKKEANQKAKLAKEKESSREKLIDKSILDVDSGDGKDKKKSAKKIILKADGKMDLDKSNLDKTSKKRKATDDTDDKGPKAKKKKEKPAKAAPKPKGPVDVERQCGVPLPNGGYCARSLTCKSHSMGAKRAVPGRSQPYDVLLAAYQKKNHAKQQMEAAMNANVSGAADDDDGNAPPVDSDEERDAVMAGIARWTPKSPWETKPWQPIRRKHQFVRMKDMLTSALRPGMELAQQQQQRQAAMLAQAGGLYTSGGLNNWGRTALGDLTGGQILQSPVTDFGADFSGFGRSGSVSMGAPPSRNSLPRKQSVVVQ